MKCTTKFESQARKRGYANICGVDEVGRGALFGPVTAAAVVLDSSHRIKGLNDSKQLTARQRETLNEQIREWALAWAIVDIDNTRIDSWNILEATKHAMKDAIVNLPCVPDFLLIDAVVIDGLDIPQQALIHGDARCASIAAASIVAKVYRDSLMAQYHDMYPQYDLIHNKGYATPKHIKALKEFGPTPLHRLSFAKVLQVQEPLQANFAFFEPDTNRSEVVSV
jgi:ribonuclease HII